MRLFLIFCVLPLAACMGREGPTVVAPPPAVPADLLVPCGGYTGPSPRTEGQLSDALVAEARGRQCANGRLAAIGEILSP